MRRTVLVLGADRRTVWPSVDRRRFGRRAEVLRDPLRCATGGLVCPGLVLTERHRHAAVTAAYGRVVDEAGTAADEGFHVLLVLPEQIEEFRRSVTPNRSDHSYMLAFLSRGDCHFGGLRTYPIRPPRALPGSDGDPTRRSSYTRGWLPGDKRSRRSPTVSAIHSCRAGPACSVRMCPWPELADFCLVVVTAGSCACGSERGVEPGRDVTGGTRVESTIRRRFGSHQPPVPPLLGSNATSKLTPVAALSPAAAPSRDGSVDVGLDAGGDVGGGVEQPLQPDPVQHGGDQADFDRRSRPG